MRLAVLFVTLPLFAQSPVQQWRAAHEHEILDEFAALLRLPNVSRNRNDLRANATLIEQMYGKRTSTWCWPVRFAAAARSMRKLRLPMTAR
jgi:hypothetical protein